MKLYMIMNADESSYWTHHKCRQQDENACLFVQTPAGFTKRRQSYTFYWKFAPAPQLIQPMRNQKYKHSDQDHDSKMQQQPPRSTNTLEDTSRTDKYRLRPPRSSASQFQSLLYKWQAELKIFFLSHRKPLNSDNVDSLQDKLKLAVNRMGGGPSVSFEEYNQKNQNIQHQSNNLSFRYGRLHPIHAPKICILRLQHFVQPVFLQVTVIDLQSRIQFSVGLNKRMNELQLALDKILCTCYPLLFIIYDRNDVESFLGKNKIMLDFYLDKLTPIDCMLQGRESVGELQYWISGSKNIYNSEGYNKHLKAFQNALQKYEFIRQSLSHNPSHSENRLLPYFQPKIAILSYNLSSTMVQPNQGSYKGQVQQYLPHLQTFISNSKKKYSKTKEAHNYKHYPMTLINGHVCWRCKARSFVGCSTCSIIEAKTVALCLDCYCPYHQPIAANIGFKSQQNNLVSKWQQLDIEVQSSIQRQFMAADLHHNNWLVKKQQ